MTPDFKAIVSRDAATPYASHPSPIELAERAILAETDRHALIALCREARWLQENVPADDDDTDEGTEWRRRHYAFLEATREHP
jgi:hypothetical protein